MKPSRTLKRRLGAFVLCAHAALGFMPLLGCGAQTSGGGTDSSSHWLDACDNDRDCGVDLDCLCGVCSKACASDSSCADLHDDAVCGDSASDCSDRAPDGVCARASDANLSDTGSDGEESDVPDDSDDSDVPDDSDVMSATTETASIATSDEESDVPDDSDETGDSETVDGSEPGPTPPAGCAPAPTALDPDGEPIRCLAGLQVCEEQCRYSCEMVDDPIDGWIPKWVVDEENACPLWSAEQCSEALNSLWASPRPCNRNEDCVVWGGQTEQTACELVFNKPVVVVSTFTPASELQAAQALYDEVVAGGCGSDSGFDHAPEEGFCEQGQCSADSGECGAACSVQEVTSVGDCADVAGYFFDGERCQALSCGCVGIDCDEMFDSLESCGAAQRAECLLSGLRDCLPESFDFGDCEAALGIGWNGFECVTVSGCSAPESALFETVEDCAAAHASCTPPSEQNIALCDSEEDCTVVPYQHCCGSTKRAINVGYQAFYEAMPEWQVYDAPECATIGICADDSAVNRAICDFSGLALSGVCQLVFP